MQTKFLVKDRRAKAIHLRKGRTSTVHFLFLISVKKMFTLSLSFLKNDSNYQATITLSLLK